MGAYVNTEEMEDHEVRELDRAYYWGAQQAAAMAHQSLKAMDDWILDGCGGRGPVITSASATTVAGE